MFFFFKKKKKFKEKLWGERTGLHIFFLSGQTPISKISRQTS